MLSKNTFAAVISAALLSGLGVQSFAQDIIKTKSGKTIEAKILEVSDETLRFKRFNNQEGPTVVIKLAKVASVTYENGEVEEFDEEEEVAVKPRSARSKSVDRSYAVPVDDNEDEGKEETPKYAKGIWKDMKENAFGVWADPAGFLQWGPMVGFHYRKNRTIFDVYTRISGLGVAYRAVSNDPDQLVGFGLGFSSQVLFPVNIGYWHVGVLTDMGYTNALYNQGGYYEEENQWYTFYVTAIGGYTIQFKGGFFMDFSVGFGTLYLSEQDYRYSNPENSYNYSSYFNRAYDGEIWAFGLFQYKVGFEF